MEDFLQLNKGALPKKESGYEIIHGKWIALGIGIILIIGLGLHLTYNFIPDLQKSYEQIKIVNKEFDCSKPFALMEKHPNMNKPMKEYILELQEYRCK
jgi:hypothetical protein